MTREEFLAIDRFICEANNFDCVFHKLKYPYFNPLTGQEVTECYIPRFIEEANWTCNVEHMIDKWREAIRRTGNDSYGTFSAFYCEMDGNNKEAMVEWILNKRQHGYVHQ